MNSTDIPDVLVQESSLNLAVPENEEAAGQTLRYLGCQPILDRKQKTFGHELLFRSGEGNYFSGDPEAASRQVIDNALTMALSGIVGGGKIFVNCTRRSLLEGLATVLPPGTTVLEVLETVHVDEALIQACTRLKERGYQLALDDYEPNAGMDRLLDLADYVKLDLQTCNRARLRKISRHVAGRGIALLAEKVETEAEFEQSMLDGFRYFQGYYFARPRLIESRQLPSNKMVTLQLLGLVTQPVLNRELMEELLMAEPSMCFRLLRMVNSAGMGLRNPVRHVKQAILLVGESDLVKLVLVASAVTLAAGARVASELILLALRRARFCEMLAVAAGESPGEQYLIGMMSVMEAMLMMPMQKITQMLPLRSEAVAALVEATGDASIPLQMARACEQQNWKAADAIRLNLQLSETQLIESYAAAERWGSEQFRNMGM